MAKLVCQSGPSAGHEYPLNKDVVVLGRSSDCDIQILDTMSSRQHCEVRRDGKLFTLVDHQSRNGTYLNEKKVTERPLSFGDRIRVGEVEYLLVKEPGDVELKDLLTKYEVSEKIGEGGMGIVYKATQRSMARVIALKVLSPKYASRPRFVEQFINEARAAGKLNHPNVIQVHDVGTENGIHYFSMEYVEGRTCMELLREQGSFTVAETLECVLQIAKALEYAHSQRLIHQDIKPDNIMISTANAVKLADLGISKSFDEVASDTGPRRVMGTPHYMAPEAAMAKKIDHRVDLYSLGATAYHLLTGKTPYSGTSATDVLKAHVMEPLPPLQDLNPDVPDDVVALIERLMAKDPQQRYQTATEVVEEVRRLQAGHGLGTERIASSDTMILRRLARGPAAKKDIGAGSAKRATPGGEQPTPRHPTRPRDGAATTGHRTRGGEDDDEADDPWRKPLRLAIVIGGALVALFLLRAIWPSSGAHVPPPRQNAPTQVQPVEAVTHRDPADPAPTDHSAEDRSAAQARALAEIERDLKTRGDRADLDALMKRLDGDELATVDPSNQARKKALVDELAKQLERRRVQGVQDAFDGLARDVDGLARDHNYELALSRIGAFPSAGEPTVAQRVADLRASVERDRDAFVGGISSREKLLVQGGDVAGLKALRDGLPPALIGSPVEQAIAKDIASLQSAAQERAQDVVKQATLELGRWNLAQVEALHDQNRKGMGDSDAGKAMDQVLRDARALGAFANAIGAVLRASGEQRFHGDIGSFRDPDLLDADLKSLKLRTSDGGTAFPVWSSLGDDVLQALATQVLRDRARDHQAALSALKAARGAKQ